MMRMVPIVRKKHKPHNMNQSSTSEQGINHVVILGGGTAGWLTAGLLAAHHNKPDARGYKLKISLVESDKIGTIGVGEGTWPTMRSTLRKIGLSETALVREANAAFKQGSQFVDWVDGSEHDAYYHPFCAPQASARLDLTPYWLQNKQQTFAHAMCFQPALCDEGLAPKNITIGEYQGLANYGYHLDAGLFSKMLHSHCTEKLGVTHIVDDVSSVERHEDGSIRGLRCEKAGLIEGDMFVDCSGFACVLIGKTLEVPFVDKRDVLMVDTALATQVEYPNPLSPIASQTISTAKPAGWVWDIGLSSRRGVGHVYSSEHMSEDEAHQVLLDHIGEGANQANIRKLSIRAGHRAKFWEKNCVAIGLSAGFLEPLEASALMLVELSATMLAEQLPARKSLLPMVQERFNQRFDYHWDRIIDFLKLHYVLSRRQEPFWQLNREKQTIPPRLLALLEEWRYRPPSRTDFELQKEVFSSESYLYVLYGMGFDTDLSHMQRSMKAHDFAQKQFQINQQVIIQNKNKLLSHRDFIAQIKDTGMHTR